MSRIDIYEGTFVLRLSLLERRLGFVRGDAQIPLAAIQNARTVDDPWAELRGERYPGTRIWNLVAVGTWRFEGGRDFVALHGRSPGVVVGLTGVDFARLVFSSQDAGLVVDEIAHAVRALDPSGDY